MKNIVSTPSVSPLVMNLLPSHRLLRFDEVNNIGEKGAKALADALKPHKNPDDSWCQNQTLRRLDLASESSSLPHFPLLSLGSPSSPSSQYALLSHAHQSGRYHLTMEVSTPNWKLSLLPRVLLPRPFQVNSIGAGGTKALAEALKPLKNPDDSWCYNQALQSLDLTGESLPLFSLFFSLGLLSSFFA